MDLNARINWSPGMELTAQTFIGLEQQLDQRQQIALRAAMGSSRLGVLPGTLTRCQGVFVGSTFEIERLKCMAVLPSGRIVNADERVTLPIPMLFGTRYYLTVTISGGETAFEREGVPYLRPQYTYAIQTQEEAEAGDVMPLVKFGVNGGVFSVDEDFILPTLMLSDNYRFAEYTAKYTKTLETLATHQNLEDGDGKRMLMRYLFLMRGYDKQHSVYELTQLTQELAQAVDYFIVSPNTEQPIEIPQPWQGDIQQWLSWVDGYLSGAISILDKVVLEDHTIDYDALLAQAKRELYGQLHPELLEKLIAQTKEELHLEIQQLSERLTVLVRDTLKTELSNDLSAELEARSTQLNDRLTESMDRMGKELSQSLYDKLFSDVYLGVYNVLHEEEEEHFIPLI